MTLAQIIKKHPFTAGLTDSQIATLAQLAHKVSFEDNEVILVTGEQARNFYLLLSGSVCVEVVTPICVVWVQILEPGDAFGWSALLDHHDTLFQVRTREASQAVCLNGDRLCALLHEDAVLAAELFRRALNLVAGRVQATETRLGELCGLKINREQPAVSG